MMKKNTPTYGPIAQSEILLNWIAVAEREQNRGVEIFTAGISTKSRVPRSI